MNHLKTLRETDLERLGRLKIFSWLTPAEVNVLGASLAMLNYKPGEVISRQSTLANVAHVLVAGIARITCLNANNERVTVALIAPGPIPELPSPPMNRFDFRSEAYNNCRVGTLDWNGFERITLNGRESAFRKFHQNDLKHWYRLLRRTSGLLNLALHERVAITMLDLCDDFGIEDSRGTLLTVSFSHKDIASIAGASRPRVTEHLRQLERDHMLFRQGRQFIVSAGKLSNSLAERQVGTHLEPPRSSTLLKESIQPPAHSLQSLAGREKGLGNKPVFTQAI
jgi:CRP/FNR family transcriptional regulator, cyclic AMP receptor protein